MSFIFGLLKKNPNWILRIYSFHDMWMCILGFVFCKNECDFPVFDAVISFQFPFLCSSVSFSSCLFCYFHPFTSRHSCLPVVKLNSGKRADAFILSNLFENWQKKTQKTFTSKDFVLCWWNGPNCELNWTLDSISWALSHTLFFWRFTAEFHLRLQYFVWCAYVSVFIFISRCARCAFNESLLWYWIHDSICFMPFHLAKMKWTRTKKENIEPKK